MTTYARRPGPAVALPLERTPARARLDHLELGRVRIVVHDLDATTEHWCAVIGLTDLGRDGAVQRLGAGTNVLVELEHDPLAPLAAPSATGMFHVALRVPTRRDVAMCLRRVAAHDFALTGTPDHLVSEALYLQDTEGNGIEVYCDRDRSDWQWTDRGVQMGSRPLDTAGLLALLADDVPDEPLPPGTVVGHAHLDVADIPATEHWYRTVVGLDTTSLRTDAAFMSAGGYHHHLGMNCWTERPRTVRGPADTGVAWITVRLRPADRDAVLARAVAAGHPVEHVGGDPALRDPAGILLRLEARAR